MAHYKNMASPLTLHILPFLPVEAACLRRSLHTSVLPLHVHGAPGLQKKWLPALCKASMMQNLIFSNIRAI